MKASNKIFCDELPPEQALWELKLNLTEQYGSYLAWLYVDYPISLYCVGLARQNINKMFEEEYSRH